MCVGVGPDEEGGSAFSTFQWHHRLHCRQKNSALRETKIEQRKERSWLFRFPENGKSQDRRYEPSLLSAPTFSSQLRIKDSRDKLITSFRKFEFGAYNPVLVECFGVDAILDPGSGIEALFPPRPPGRPKKIRLEAQKDNKAAKTLRVLDILGQTTDSKTKETYMF